MKTNNKLALIVMGLFMVFGQFYVPNALALSDKLIKQRIENEAEDTFRLRGTKVNLAVEKGYIVIFGEVDLYIQKLLYEKIAWKTQGVIEVDNEIRVVSRFPQADAAIKRKIMEIVQTHRRFHGAKVAVQVKTGAVHIRINLDRPSDVLFLKHRVAEIEGVISIDIQAKFFV